MLSEEARGPVRRVAEKLGVGPYSQVAAPMVWEDRPVGWLYAVRRPATGFSETEIDLMRTFADQAVIAIQNARLFNETKEALERQTATGRILSAMSGSMTDAKPVFDAIVESCQSLFEDSAVALRLVRDGALHVEANVGIDSGPVPLDRTSAVGTCVLEARTIHSPDMAAALETFPRGAQMGVKLGFRSAVFAPLVRDGVGIGTIAIFRRQLGAFSNRDIELLNTFAGQAVIAIENVRLFNETREALERQRASAEVLQVISSSVADTGPVFERILASCQQLFGGMHIGIAVVGDDGAIHLQAYAGPNRAAFEGIFPLPLSFESGAGQRSSGAASRTTGTSSPITTSPSMYGAAARSPASAPSSSRRCCGRAAASERSGSAA